MARVNATNPIPADIHNLHNLSMMLCSFPRLEILGIKLITQNITCLAKTIAAAIPKA